MDRRKEKRRWRDYGERWEEREKEMNRYVMTEVRRVIEVKKGN